MAVETVIAATGLPPTSRVGNGSTRPAAQTTSPDSSAADRPTFVERTARAAGQAIYFSPVLQFDRKQQELFIRFRDADTGEVTRQYPSPAAVKVYQQAEEQNRENIETNNALAADAAQAAADLVAANQSGGQKSTNSARTAGSSSASPNLPAPREIPESKFGQPAGGQSPVAYAFSSYSQIANFKNPFGSSLHERAVA